MADDSRETLPASATLRPADRVVAVADGDGYALCALATASVYALSPAGGAVWTALPATGIRFGALLHVLGISADSTLGSPAHDAVAAVDRLVHQFEALQLVVIDTDHRSG